jgi:hypothetical protein
VTISVYGVYRGIRGGERTLDAYLATPVITVSRVEPTFDGEESDVEILARQEDELFRLWIDPASCQDLIDHLTRALAQDPPADAPPPRRRGRRRQEVDAPPPAAPTPEPRRARLERLMGLVDDDAGSTCALRSR